jgi:hypothetical protein
MMSEEQQFTLIQLLVLSGFTWQEMEKLMLTAALIRHGGNRTYVASEIGLCIRTVRNKIALHQLGQAKDYRHGKKTESQ